MEPRLKTRLFALVFFEMGCGYTSASRRKIPLTARREILAYISPVTKAKHNPNHNRSLPPLY